jgi:hypothetical protein
VNTQREEEEERSVSLAEPEDDLSRGERRAAVGRETSDDEDEDDEDNDEEDDDEDDEEDDQDEDGDKDEDDDDDEQRVLPTSSVPCHTHATLHRYQSWFGWSQAV